MITRTCDICGKVHVVPAKRVWKVSRKSRHPGKVTPDVFLVKLDVTFEPCPTYESFDADLCAGCFTDLLGEAVSAPEPEDPK